MERNLSEVPIPTGAGSDDMAMHEGIMVVGQGCPITDVNPRLR
jgi:hypothetical protein